MFDDELYINCSRQLQNQFSLFYCEHIVTSNKRTKHAQVSGLTLKSLTHTTIPFALYNYNKKVCPLKFIVCTVHRWFRLMCIWYMRFVHSLPHSVCWFSVPMKFVRWKDFMRKHFSFLKFLGPF